MRNRPGARRKVSETRRRVSEASPPSGAATLVARDVPCPACAGRGDWPAAFCEACAMVAGWGGPPVLCWLEPLDDGRALPCGHPGTLRRDTWADCPKCWGRGAVTARRTRAAWAKRDAQAARERKRANGLLAGALRRTGGPRGMGRAAWRALIASVWPPCGARTRAGGSCRNRILAGGVRCRCHGGGSTGPVTEAGREAIRASNRRRAKGAHPPTLPTPPATPTAPAAGPRLDASASRPSRG